MESKKQPSVYSQNSTAEGTLILAENEIEENVIDEECEIFSHLNSADFRSSRKADYVIQTKCSIPVSTQESANISKTHVFENQISPKTSIDDHHPIEEVDISYQPPVRLTLKDKYQWDFR